MILGFDEEELKMWFLILAVIFSVLRMLQGDLITPSIIIPLSLYLMYRENKSRDWEVFKSFLKEFRKAEKEQKEVVEEEELEDWKEDDELMEKLTREMRRR